VVTNSISTRLYVGNDIEPSLGGLMGMEMHRGALGTA
jgi:hypothetical protein